MTTIRAFVDRSIPVGRDTSIAVAEWPGKKGPLVCIHGLTSSSRAFCGLATELPAYRIISVDCRGRGASSKSPPFGIAQHVMDLAAVFDESRIERATLVGHSMGAFIARAFCDTHPTKVERLVLIDGGYSAELPPGATPDSVLEFMLSPFLAKMRRSWKSFDEYIAYYEATNLYPNGVDEYGRAHFAYDLVGQPPALQSRIVEACIAPDWRDVLDRDVIAARLKRTKVPLLLVRAPEGFTGNRDEVIPDSVRDAVLKMVPTAKVVDIPGTNHHTILCSKSGASALAREIETFLSAS